MTPKSPVETLQGPAEMYTALRDIGVETAAARRVRNIEFSRGPATFMLDDGRWLPFEPVAGWVTGAVFIGKGRVFYNPPLGIERDQLVKFTDSEALTEEFDRLYLRFTDRTADFVGATPHADVGENDLPSAVPFSDDDVR